MRLNEIILFSTLIFISCKKQDVPSTDWKRFGEPIYRDEIPEHNYEVASDGHIFVEDGIFHMIYSGDSDDHSSIKMATGSNAHSWSYDKVLLSEVGPSGTDREKETAFYRQTIDGIHQIYYIGYNETDSYEAEVYLAESSSIDGPYLQQSSPIISRGEIAGQPVYCITSPSIVEHDSLLYICFLGWNDSPANVSVVWTLGAVSSDEGHSWSDFQEIDCPIGMEGQITKGPDERFYAVRTGEFDNREAIFYAESDHPFGPWERKETPILTQAGKPFETDEIIAPQITFDPLTNKKLLYYTGANHKKGWWIMLAEEN